MHPMFIAAQFTIAKCWKQPKCSLVNRVAQKLWYIYTMESYAAERKKELLPFKTSHTGQNGHHKQINKQQVLARLWRKGNPSTLLVGMQTGAATVESSVEFPQKIKNGTAF